MLPKHVLVVGAAGMVGSAICRALKSAGINYTGTTRRDADLTDRRQVDRLLASGGYDFVVIAAAKVGGIHANNSYPADFIYENLAIETALIDSTHRHGIRNLLFLGSSCIYPKDTTQPIAEEALLTGLLEPTNEPYAIAKIAGIKLCESYNRQYGTDYRSLMPTNLYGPEDNFHPENSHVIPALMQRFHQAKELGLQEVTVWGSGRPRREFLHVDDLASAAVHVMMLDEKVYASHVDSRCSHVNVGTGKDVSISELAELIRDAVHLNARLVFDPSMPDGMPRKLLNIDRIRSLGWSPSIELAAGLRETYEWFRSRQASLRS